MANQSQGAATMRDHFAAFRKQRGAPPIPANDLSVSASHRFLRRNTYSQPGPEPVDLEERAAMAVEGGLAALYVDAFARMQVVHPIRLSRDEWARMIDDAGRFLGA